ncbi:MAG: hypothetical protein HY000_04740 [Planctomycetes bacterium]|nr:hypothetical protein [Planctomycetota bacterium]
MPLRVALQNMSATPAELVRLIHQSPTPVVLAITGGGSGAIAELLREPGASRTVLEAIVPYAAAALTEWLGSTPEHFCAPPTASAMAMVAYLRARRLLQPEGQARQLSAAGIGCTASLASDRPKRGPHRAHVAWQTVTVSGVLSLDLHKGKRSRAEEESVVAGLVLNAVAEACGLVERADLALLPGEAVQTAIAKAPLVWQELLSGSRRAVRQGAAGDGESASQPRAIFPGAFNPLHIGHRRMAEMGSRLLSRPVEFEISIENVDKPPLDFLQMQQRADQFSSGDRLWFTRAATFVEKAAIFPHATFLVGVDTLIRIADPKYYCSEINCNAALEQIASHGCRFLVFGRATATGFQTLSDLQLPPALFAICCEVPAAEFREDISSTELRKQREHGD